MICSHAALFPAASSAVQVRTIDSVSPQPDVMVSLWVICGIESQLSVAMAKPVLAVLVSAGHSRVKVAGQVITGGMVSTTSTVRVTWPEVFPQSSIAS